MFVNVRVRCIFRFINGTVLVQNEVLKLSMLVLQFWRACNLMHTPRACCLCEIERCMHASHFVV